MRDLLAIQWRGGGVVLVHGIRACPKTQKIDNIFLSK